MKYVFAFILGALAMWIFSGQAEDFYYATLNAIIIGVANCELI
jgi:hypothetical protein